MKIQEVCIGVRPRALVCTRQDAWDAPGTSMAEGSPAPPPPNPAPPSPQTGVVGSKGQMNLSSDWDQIKVTLKRLVGGWRGGGGGRVTDGWGFQGCDYVRHEGRRCVTE